MMPPKLWYSLAIRKFKTTLTGKTRKVAAHSCGKIPTGNRGKVRISSFSQSYWRARGSTLLVSLAMEYGAKHFLLEIVQQVFPDIATFFA